MPDSIGINRITGQVITDWQHVVQSVADILSTPRLVRIMRRDYGSDTPGLVDKPTTDVALLRFYVEAAEAIDQEEPRYVLARIGFGSANREGQVTIGMSGIYRPRALYGDLTPARTPDRSIVLLLADQGMKPVF